MSATGERRLVELVRATRATGDDTELGVYADSLEHRDPARGNLIHLQCELRKLEPDTRRARELRDEIAAIVDDHGDRWRAELPSIPGVTWLDFELGGVASARVVDTKRFAAHVDEIGEAAPITTIELAAIDALGDGVFAPPAWLDTLRTGHIFGADRALASAPRSIVIDATRHDDVEWIDRDEPLAALSIVDSDSIGDEFTTWLADASWAKALTTLEMPSRFEGDNTGYEGDPRMTADGAHALARLVQLERLAIDRHPIGSAELRRLIGKLKRLTSLSARECRITKLQPLVDGAPLRELDLGRNALALDGATALANSPRARELRTLKLDTCEISAFGLAAIVASPMWQTLRRLELPRNPLTTSAIRTLASAPAPKQLYALVLADADLDEDAVPQLAKVTWLGQLAELDLSGNLLGRGLAQLRALPADQLRRLGLAAVGMQRSDAVGLARLWPHLVELDLASNVLTDAGLERFVTMKEASALQRLVLRDCKLGPDGLELLATRARCPRLRHLELGGNSLGDSLAAFLATPVASRLVSLDVSSCELGAAAIAALATCELPRLRTLRLRGNELDHHQLLAIARAPTLRGVTSFAVDGKPWTYPAEVTRELLARFGDNWFAAEP